MCFETGIIHLSLFVSQYLQVVEHMSVAFTDWVVCMENPIKCFFLENYSFNIIMRSEFLSGRKQSDSLRLKKHNIGRLI